MPMDSSGSRTSFDAQRGDLGWLGGTAIGEVPDGPLNPVLYPRTSGA